MTPLESKDSEWLAEIHAVSFPNFWGEIEFQELFNSDAYGWQIDRQSFILLRNAADESEIITFATHPDARGQGLASQLLEHTIEHLRENHYSRLFLEVRDDNTAAVQLYRKHSFSQIAIRSGYYHLPNGSRKDALVMERALTFLTILNS